MRILSIIDRYIISKFLKTFFFTIGIFSLITIFIDISEKIDDFIKRKPPLTSIIFDYYIWFIPYITALLCPIFVFLAVLFFNSKMAQNSEIISMLNTGASYRRILKPYLLASSFLTALYLLMNTQVVPYCDKKRYMFEDNWIHEKKQVQNNNISCQINPGTIIHMESFNYLDSIGFGFSMERSVDNKLQSRTFASRLIWNKTLNRWSLENYQQRFFTSEGEKVIKGQLMDTVLSIKPDEFVVKSQIISSMTNPELNEYIRSEREKGSGMINKYKVELIRRTAQPISFYVLTLLAVAISSRKSRGGTGLHMGIGIFVTFAYMLIQQVFNTFGMNNVMMPEIAVWLPVFIFGLFAFIMVIKSPK
jgi:lipopolysaccharide export system permease protein